MTRKEENSWINHRNATKRFGVKWFGVSKRTVKHAKKFSQKLRRGELVFVPRLDSYWPT
jgi:hypothetical protein